MSVDKNTLIHVNKLVQDHKLIKGGGQCLNYGLSDFKAGISGSLMYSTFKVLLWLPPEVGNWGQEVCT